MYDLIGDIHGHADEMVQLLDILGYRKTRGVYGHPERQVIFLGDFIDRGPQIKQVLEIVRPMIEERKALAVMGNHELNALAFHTENSDAHGEFLREHSGKNVHQHHKTLEQLTANEITSCLDWFRTLPMWLDLDGLRAVHACWDEQAINLIAEGYSEHGGVTSHFLHSACREGKPLFSPVEIALKGKEVKLPKGMSFTDKDGNLRTETRVRWYLSPKDQTYRRYALTDEIASDEFLERSLIDVAAPYPVDAKPVFVGHYWLSAQRPEVLADNVACVDYSVAKGGFLCAYRWNGEQKLNNENFVWAAK
jgi:hypothetical protein